MTGTGIDRGECRIDASACRHGYPSMNRVLIDGKTRLDHGVTGKIGGEIIMSNEKGPNIKKKQKCKNCEGKGLVKKGDKVMKCQRCKGTGVR